VCNDLCSSSEESVQHRTTIVIIVVIHSPYCHCDWSGAKQSGEEVTVEVIIIIIIISIGLHLAIQWQQAPPKLTSLYYYQQPQQSDGSIYQLR
jgi:hypothetical protein